MGVRLVALGILTVATVGCSAPHGTVVSKSLPSRISTSPRYVPIDLKNDHLIGVGTVAITNADKVGSVLDINRIPYGRFNDLNSCGFVVAEPNADRARRLIREDSWNHGYELLKYVNPTPENIARTTVSTGEFFECEVARKDADDAVHSLNAKGINFVGLRIMGENATIMIFPKDEAVARRLIQEDALVKGYGFRFLNPKENIHSSDQSTINPEMKPDALSRLVVSPSSKWAGKLVTVAAVANKDAKLAIECLRSSGIKVHGTWESRGVTGVVIADGVDQLNAVKMIQEDAHRRGYRLLSTDAREPVAPATNDWSKPPPSKEDLTAEANLIVFVKEKDQPFVSDCLEANGISSGASCNHGSCGVYVSKLDADRAISLIQEDARIRGYAYSTQRIHYR